ncbi:hypothetical protein K438DRAFT_1982549 [Mycena galopus ATCC 62051]|nr:hypothetical protein K438DRAFT_1982549 [Mycena galopus ATCC 62051]
MALESNSPAKIEEQDLKDVKMATVQAVAIATADPGDPYAAAARALSEAQRALSAARSAPQTPMISVEEADKQANELKAEIATLTKSFAQEQARTNALQVAARNQGKG